MQDLLTYKNTGVFEYFYNELKNDYKLYEIKLALFQRIMPLMNNEQASLLMKEFEKIIEVQADESIFRLNINPIRTGLALFKTFDDI